MNDNERRPRRMRDRMRDRAKKPSSWIAVAIAAAATAYGVNPQLAGVISDIASAVLAGGGK